MLMSFETPTGITLFKVLNKGKLDKVEGFLVAAIPRGYLRGNLAPNVNSMLIGDE